MDVAYYLVHSLSRHDFRQADRTAAELVARAAADAGVRRIVYLGGLRPEREDSPSRHLASRAEVGDVFLRAVVPAAVLQAGVITGSGSTSFEMVRYLTDRLPLMITLGGCASGRSRSPSRTCCAISSGARRCRPRSTAPSTSAARMCSPIWR